MLFDTVIKEGVLLVPGAWFEAKDYTIVDRVERKKSKDYLFQEEHAAVAEELDTGLERF